MIQSEKHIIKFCPNNSLPMYVGNDWLNTAGGIHDLVYNIEDAWVFDAEKMEDNIFYFSDNADFEIIAAFVEPNIEELVML